MIVDISEPYYFCDRNLKIKLEGYTFWSIKCFVLNMNPTSLFLFYDISSLCTVKLKPLGSPTKFRLISVNCKSPCVVLVNLNHSKLRSKVACVSLPMSNLCFIPDHTLRPHYLPLTWPHNASDAERRKLAVQLFFKFVYVVFDNLCFV